MVTHVVNGMFILVQLVPVTSAPNCLRTFTYVFSPMTEFGMVTHMLKFVRTNVYRDVFFI